MRFYLLSVAVLCAFHLTFTTSVPDDRAAVQEILKHHMLNEIPSSVLEEIERNNVPAKVNLVKPKNFEKIPIVPGKSVDPNAVTDSVIRNVDQAIKASGVDPYTVTDFHFLIFTIRLTVGNFGNLHRHGDANMVVYDQYNYEFFSPVQVFQLEGNFSFSFRFMGFNYNAGVDVKVSTADADVDFTVAVNSATNQTYVNVNSLRSVNIGFITFDIHGLGPLNGLANLIANVFVNLFKCIIPIFFNGVFRSIINQILASMYPPW